MEWPGRCSACKEAIADWSEAGYNDGRWIHKSCWTEALLHSEAADSARPVLQSPLERARQLDLPMMVYVLLFHFGSGAAVIGWILFTQGYDEATGVVVFPIGLVATLIGVAGAAVNIMSRRRIEGIRRALEMQGGWKPGR
jgi:hypothetical protein